MFTQGNKFVVSLIQLLQIAQHYLGACAVQLTQSHEEEVTGLRNGGSSWIKLVYLLCSSLVTSWLGDAWGSPEDSWLASASVIKSVTKTKPSKQVLIW